MRKAIAGLGGPPTHLGLAYDVWAPVDDSGKVPDADRQRWLESLGGIKMPDGYAEAYRRWVDALRAANCRADSMETTSRLLIGHGNPAPTEVGLTLQQTWGVPVIPGSALKGLLAHYVETAYGPDPAGAAGADAADRARFSGVAWRNGRVAQGPGDVYGMLFGAPPADNAVDGGAEERAGCVVFHDAWLVPDGVGRVPVAPDVLTVHQKKYYDEMGASLPNDYESPVPVAFLTVTPGTRFLVAVSGDPAWSEFAMTLLREALEDWGVGGKTAAGYGRLKFVSSVVRPDRLSNLDSRVADFVSWTKTAEAQDMTARPRARAIRQEWLEKLLELPRAAREDAAKVIKAFVKNKQEQEDLCRDLLA